MAIAALALVGLTAGAGSLHAQADLSVGDGAAKPTETDEVSIDVVSNPGASALQLDIPFDDALLTAGTPVGSAGLVDHVVSHVEPQPGLLRIVLYSPTNAPLPTGEVLRVPFTAKAAATVGETALAPMAAEVATPDAAVVLPLTLTPGSFHVFALEADLALQLAADRSLVADGDPLTYTLAVSNPGPDAVTGVQVTDVLPADLVSVDWSCTPAGGATCTTAGSGNVDDLVDLPLTGAATYTIAGTVSTGASFIDNSADLQVPDEIFDPEPGDNSDTVSVDVCADDDVVLTSWDIGGVAVFDACVTLTAGPSFNIQDTGIVTLRSLGSVILRDGFSVESGGTLTVSIQ
jgi:uncharacterized repeat protein (TIGR01451 family)